MHSIQHPKHPISKDFSDYSNGDNLILMLVMYSKSVTKSNTATTHIPTSKTQHKDVEAEKLNNDYGNVFNNVYC